MCDSLTHTCENSNDNNLAGGQVCFVNNLAGGQVSVLNNLASGQVIIFFFLHYINFYNNLATSQVIQQTNVATSQVIHKTNLATSQVIHISILIHMCNNFIHAHPTYTHNHQPTTH
jgi:hypothetical protein